MKANARIHSYGLDIFQTFIARKSSYRCAIASALISRAFRTHVSILRYSNEHFHTFRRNMRTIIPLLSDHERHKCIGRDQSVLLSAFPALRIMIMFYHTK